jgi:DNA-binding LacI/PurR family transcriptional regulator
MKNKGLSGLRLMAQKLGVSTATISRALSPETSHMVNEARRAEILELADKLRYRPNPGARLIQRGTANTIAVLIPGGQDVFFSEFYGRFLGGIIHVMEHTDWDVRISTLKRSEGSFIDDLRRAGLGASGLIYAGLPLSQEQVDAVSAYHSPMVVLGSVLPCDCPVKDVGCHVIGVDNYNGAMRAVEYIAQLGHRDIGFILGPWRSRDFYERKRGYLDGLKKVGLPVCEEMFFTGSYNQDHGRIGCQYFLSRKKRPTALICASDTAAFGALYQAKDKGLKCPEDLSIIGFDDGPWAISSTPKLTTVRQPLGQLTERAVNILMQSILDSNSNKLSKLELPATLNIRESAAYLQR